MLTPVPHGTNARNDKEIRVLKELDLKIGAPASAKPQIILNTRTACNPGATCQSTLPKTTCK
jgi:hypothetical protein